MRRAFERNITRMLFMHDIVPCSNEDLINEY
jgi:hypothetical protein